MFVDGIIWKWNLVLALLAEWDELNRNNIYFYQQHIYEYDKRVDRCSSYHRRTKKYTIWCKSYGQ